MLNQIKISLHMLLWINLKPYKVRLIMKKKKMLTAGLAIVMTSGLFGMMSAMSEIESDVIFDANVEALARGEGGGKAICYSEIVFAEGYSCLQCGTCDFVEGHGAQKGGYCKW